MKYIKESIAYTLGGIGMILFMTMGFAIVENYFAHNPQYLQIISSSLMVRDIDRVRIYINLPLMMVGGENEQSTRSLCLLFCYWFMLGGFLFLAGYGFIRWMKERRKNSNIKYPKKWVFLPCSVLVLFLFLIRLSTFMSVSQLSSSVYCHDYEEVKRLVKTGTSVNVSDESGITPIMHAILQKDIKMVKLLLELGGDPNLPSNCPNGLPLSIVCLWENHAESLEFAKILLAHGADPNREWRGNFPLFNAVSRKNIDLITLLLNHNADINKTDSYKYNIIAMCICTKIDSAGEAEQCLKIMKLLFDRGFTNINSKDYGGETVLSAAQRLKIKPEFIELLRQHGAKTDEELK